MRAELTGLVTGLKGLTLVAGGLISYYAYRAYRRTRHPALRALAAGFGTITIGSLLAGMVDKLLPVTRSHALLVESVFTLLGFAIVLYSLFMTAPTTRRLGVGGSSPNGTRSSE